jgi:hypothetical protein
MLGVVSPFILWPVGIALGGLLFFVIAKRSWRVDSVLRGVEAKSTATGPERPAANAKLRPGSWSSRPAEAQRILAWNDSGWSVPLRTVNPTRREATVLVSIRVIGEGDAFAGGQAEFDLDVMTLVTAPRPGVGYGEQFVTIIDPPEMVAPGVAGI